MPARADKAPRAHAHASLRRAIAAADRGAAGARAGLVHALDDSVARGDLRGAALAAAALCIDGQINGDFRHFDDYIAQLAIVRDPATGWETTNDECLALTGLLTALNYFRADDTFIPTCVERVLALLGTAIDVNVRFAAGRALLYYAEPRELRVLGQRVHSLLQPAIDDPALAPHRQAHWLLMWARCSRFAKEVRQADAADARLAALLRTHDLRGVRFTLRFADAQRAVASGMVPQAERAIAAAEAACDSSQLGELRMTEYLKTRLAELKGQGDRAVFHAVRSAGYSREVNDPPVVQAVHVVSEAQARLFIHDFRRAFELMREAIPMVPAGFAAEVRDNLALAEGYAAVHQGDPEGVARLAAAWAAVRERAYFDTFEGAPMFDARLCALSLVHGIEAEFVRAHIEALHLRPPPDAPDAWPWPVRLQALGGFTIMREGVALAFEGKAQKKPIELAKMLMALGGRGVAKQKLHDLLWPDANADAAAAALDVLISRLRKLVRDPDAIRVDEGKVGFDVDRVWLDTWAFDRDVEALQQALAGPDTPDAVERLGQQLLKRYSGPFLGSEDPERWSIAARNRWQNRFRRSLADAGRYWEARGEWTRAIALYERALDEDSIAEDLYRRLMRAHLARGEPAEAARVYRRCRDMLSVQLGIPPSPDTEALFRTIYCNPGDAATPIR